MKIKSIESILKSKKHIQIMTNDDIQWIGDGAAFYPLYGFPILEESTIFKFFDIREDKQEKYTYTEGTFPPTIDLTDYCPQDKAVRRGNLLIVQHGEKLLPIFTDSGVVYINAKYLSPFADEETYELFERKTGGTRVIVVKTGFLLAGIIALCELTELLELQEIAKRTERLTDKQS